MSPVGADKIGPYEILELLHSDERGRVYRARDTRLGRIVAIKVLPVPFSQNGESLEKVERRARAISSLDHPNICRLYDVGCEDGLDYLVMEYLEGESLAERLTKGRSNRWSCCDRRLSGDGVSERRDAGVAIEARTPGREGGGALRNPTGGCAGTSTPAGSHPP